MIQIVLHSSKTMRRGRAEYAPLDMPQFIAQATELAAMLRGLSAGELAGLMKLSTAKAEDVQQLYGAWPSQSGATMSAIDAFIGDIYSGLQVQTWSDDDRRYAHQHLLILSGLYGALRACDGVRPYRLEMGYKLPNGESLYQFWGDRLATAIGPDTRLLVNLSAVEYTKALLPHVDTPVITPKFMTVSPKTGEPKFVTVHAKIARGAYAGWLIRERIASTDQLPHFAELGYAYSEQLSTPSQPVFVCQEFGGIGMSVRLS